MSDFSISDFQDLLSVVTHKIAGAPLNKDLQELLNREFPINGEVCKSIEQACLNGIESGDLCKYEAEGIKYGRVIKPTPELLGFSVDVVEMNSIVGPYHRHPGGEIDLIMPMEDGAKFDDHEAGWLVYEPGSEHAPTVTEGRAVILYLLPEGAIEFKQPAH